MTPHLFASDLRWLILTAVLFGGLVGALVGAATGAIREDNAAAADERADAALPYLNV